MLDELIVNVYLDVVGAWNIRRGGFWPHRNEGVSKGDIVGQRKGLLVRCEFFHDVGIGTEAYLVIRRD